FLQERRELEFSVTFQAEASLYTQRNDGSQKGGCGGSPGRRGGASSGGSCATGPGEIWRSLRDSFRTNLCLYRQTRAQPGYCRGLDLRRIPQSPGEFAEL